jgi:hypothetical protein
MVCEIGWRAQPTQNRSGPLIGSVAVMVEQYWPKLMMRTGSDFCRDGGRLHLKRLPYRVMAGCPLLPSA